MEGTDADQAGTPCWDLNASEERDGDDTEAGAAGGGGVSLGVSTSPGVADAEARSFLHMQAQVDYDQYLAAKGAAGGARVEMPSEVRREVRLPRAMTRARGSEFAATREQHLEERVRELRVLLDESISTTAALSGQLADQQEENRVQRDALRTMNEQRIDNVLKLGTVHCQCRACTEEIACAYTDAVQTENRGLNAIIEEASEERVRLMALIHEQAGKLLQQKQEIEMRTEENKKLAAAELALGSKTKLTQQALDKLAVARKESAEAQKELAVAQKALASANDALLKLQADHAKQEQTLKHQRHSTATILVSRNTLALEVKEVTAEKNQLVTDMTKQTEQLRSVEADCIARDDEIKKLKMQLQERDDAIAILKKDKQSYADEEAAQRELIRTLRYELQQNEARRALVASVSWRDAQEMVYAAMEARAEKAIEEESDTLCQVCLSKAPDTSMLPCGHTFCDACSPAVGELCHNCRQVVHGKQAKP